IVSRPLFEVPLPRQRGPRQIERPKAAHVMKIICCFVLVCASLCFAAEPQKFTVSRSLKRPLAEVRAAVLTYCVEAKTNNHSFSAGTPKDEAGRFTQSWFDCAGAPPGALMGEIIAMAEPGPIIST